MQDICSDLLAEYRDLAALSETLTPPQWLQRSEFYGWTPWDEIAHLCYFDETGLQSARDPEGFACGAALLNQRMERGEEISALARAQFGSLDGPASHSPSSSHPSERSSSSTPTHYSSLTPKCFSTTRITFALAPFSLRIG